VENPVEASVCDRQAGKEQRRWRDGGNGAGAQRRRRAADGRPPLMWPLELPLATNALLSSGTGAAGGEQGSRQP